MNKARSGNSTGLARRRSGISPAGIITILLALLGITLATVAIGLGVGLTVDAGRRDTSTATVASRSKAPILILLTRNVNGSDLQTALTQRTNQFNNTANLLNVPTFIMVNKSTSAPMSNWTGFAYYLAVCPECQQNRTRFLQRNYDNVTVPAAPPPGTARITNITITGTETPVSQAEYNRVTS